MGNPISCTTLKQVDQGRFQCIQPDGTAIDVHVDKSSTTGQLDHIELRDLKRTASDKFIGKTASGETAEITVHTDPTTKRRVIERADIQGADGQWRRYETAAGLQASAQRFHARAVAVGSSAAAADTVPVHPADIRFAPGEEQLAGARERQELRAAYQAREAQLTTATDTAVTILGTVRRQRTDFVVHHAGNTITVSRRATPTDEKVLELTTDRGVLTVSHFANGRAETWSFGGQRAHTILTAARGLAYVDPPTGSPTPSSGGSRLTPLERDFLQLFRQWQRMLQPNS